LRHDHRTPGPRLDDVLAALFVLSLNLLDEVLVHERTLLKATWHQTCSLPLLLTATPTPHDELLAGLVVVTGPAFLDAPGADRVATTGGLALTTTVGVVDGVHHDTADDRALALPTATAGLAPADVGLLGVADLPDRRAAADLHHAHLTGGHTQRGVVAFLGQELDLRAGGAAQLATATRLQLDRVHERTRGDVAQREAVTGLDVGLRTVLDLGALLEAGGRQDVALLAVHVVQQRDTSGAVRVVLDVGDLGRHAVLVVPTEVDHAVGTLVAATLVAGGDTAVAVAAALGVQRTDQGLLRLRARDLDEVAHAGAATSRRRRLVLTNAHLLRAFLYVLLTVERFDPAGSQTPKM